MADLRKQVARHKADASRALEVLKQQRDTAADDAHQATQIHQKAMVRPFSSVLSRTGKNCRAETGRLPKERRPCLPAQPPDSCRSCIGSDMRTYTHSHTYTRTHACLLVTPLATRIGGSPYTRPPDSYWSIIGLLLLDTRINTHTNTHTDIPTYTHTRLYHPWRHASYECIGGGPGTHTHTHSLAIPAELFIAHTHTNSRTHNSKNLHTLPFSLTHTHTHRRHYVLSLLPVTPNWSLIIQPPLHKSRCISSWLCPPT
jgi:hypothetical protein